MSTSLGDARTALDGWAASRETHWGGLRQCTAAEPRSGKHVCGQSSAGAPGLTHSHRRWERISRNTGHGWRPAGDGASETARPESGGELRREDEERELTCRVFR